MSGLRSNADHGSRPQKGTQARIVAQIPARRIASPEEIAAAFVWLASDEASYANGIAIALLLDGAASAGFAGCFI